MVDIRNLDPLRLGTCSFAACGDRATHRLAIVRQNGEVVTTDSVACEIHASALNLSPSFSLALRRVPRISKVYA